MRVLKVLALGGSGDMGRMAVTVLLPSPKITSITIADKNYEFSKKFVELIGSEKLSAVEIDVTNKKELNDLIKSTNISANDFNRYYFKKSQPISVSEKIYTLIKRPEIELESMLRKIKTKTPSIKTKTPSKIKT